MKKLLAIILIVAACNDRGADDIDYIPTDTLPSDTIINPVDSTVRPL